MHKAVLDLITLDADQATGARLNILTATARVRADQHARILTA